MTVSLGIGIYWFLRYFKKKFKINFKTLSMLMKTFSVGILYNCNLYIIFLSLGVFSIIKYFI